MQVNTLLLAFETEETMAGVAVTDVCPSLTNRPHEDLKGETHDVAHLQRILLFEDDIGE